MTYKPEDNLMELIWDNLPKAPDDDHVTFTREDIESIWSNGFVDAEKYPVGEWVKIFEPHKAEEDKYILTKPDFIEKDKYRYRGEIKIPFEAFIINEGQYTDEGLQELIDMSIAPSCSKSPKDLKEFFDEFKDLFREEDGLIRMDMRGKREIAILLHNFPSPLRKMELMFDAMVMQEVQDRLSGKKNPFATASAEQTAKLQISTFSTLPSNIAEKASLDLKTMEKRVAPEDKAKEEKDDNGVEMKKIRRSRKGFRG